MKGKCYIVSDYKQTNNVCFEYLKQKLLQDTDVCRVLMKKCKRMARKTYLETTKQ